MEHNLNAKSSSLENRAENVNSTESSTGIEISGNASREDTASKREMYPYLTDSIYESIKHSGKENMKILHDIYREVYEERIVHYSLKVNQKLERLESTKSINIVLFGKRGVGKSSTANTILGKKCFHTSAVSESVTKSSSFSTSSDRNRTITVVDTPGVHDTKQDKSEIVKELTRIPFLLRRGVHCFVICMCASDTRFTRETVEMLKHIKVDGRDDVLNYCMLVYTKAETELNLSSLNDFLDEKKENEDNKLFLERIGDRVVAVNNSTDIPAEIQRNRDVLIAMADEIIKNNEKQNLPEIYTNKTFQKTDELYERMAELVRRHKYQQVLVNGVIEGMTHISFNVFSKDIFVEKVMRIIYKSESSKGNNKTQNVRFMTADKTITIPVATCRKQIELLFTVLDGDVIIFRNKMICAAMGVAATATSITMVIFACGQFHCMKN